MEKILFLRPFSTHFPLMPLLPEDGNLRGAFLFFSINSLSRFPPFLTTTKSSIPSASSVIISPNFLVVFNPLSLFGKFWRNSWFLPIFIPPLTKILQVAEVRALCCLWCLISIFFFFVSFLLGKVFLSFFEIFDLYCVVEFLICGFGCFDLCFSVLVAEKKR